MYDRVGDSAIAYLSFHSDHNLCPRLAVISSAIVCEAQPQATLSGALITTMSGQGSHPRMVARVWIKLWSLCLLYKQKMSIVCGCNALSKFLNRH